MHGRAIVFGGALLAVLAACESEPAVEPIALARPPQIREGGTERPSRLIVGLTPFIPEADLRKEFAPLLDYLSKKVGLPIDIRGAESYAATSKLFAEYHVHIGVLSPLAYVRAKRDNPDLILLATHIADGSSTYSGYIVARDDAGFNSIQDLKGKRFLYIDRSSASGYLYTVAYLHALGINPEKFFKSLAFGGNHEKVLDSIVNRDADAGAVASTVFRMYRDKKTEGRRLKIIAKTGRIPYDAYCASPRLDQTLVDQIRAALLDLSTRTDEGRQVLQGLTEINGFVSVGDDHYDEVRRVARMVDEFPTADAPTPQREPSLTP
jgi:phosphate/phosphite/phosphonate ABC transporter binding protein